MRPGGNARVLPGTGERRAKRGARSGTSLRAAPRGVFSISAQARASGQGKARRSRDRLHGGILSSAASRGDFESPAGTSRGATDAGRDSSATRTSRAPRGLGCSVHRRAKARGAIVRIAVTDGASSLAHRPCSPLFPDEPGTLETIRCLARRFYSAEDSADTKHGRAPIPGKTVALVFSRDETFQSPSGGSRAPSFASAVHTRVTRRIQNGPNQAVSDPSSRVPLFAGLGTASARVAPGLPGARASRPKAPDACILGFHRPGHRLTSALTPLLPQCHRHESDRPHRLPRSGTYRARASSRGRRTRRAGHSRTTNLCPRCFALACAT